MYAKSVCQLTVARTKPISETYEPHRHNNRVAARLIRLNSGNFGDCKPVGDGVWELRIDWGPGYRVYYAIEGKRVVLLCDGGDKRSQTADIDRAIERWNEWQTRGKK